MVMKKRGLTHFEPLEPRIALTCAPTLTTSVFPRIEHCWQNEELPADVNNDGSIAASDVMIVVNEMIERNFSDPKHAWLPITPFPIASSIEAFPYDFDVSGDRRVTALDVIRVINSIDNVPILDLNGDANGRSGLERTLEWNAESVALLADDAVIRASASGMLESATLRWRSPGNSTTFSVITDGTNITATLEAEMLRLEGLDTIENYQAVLKRIRVVGDPSDERREAFFLILFDIDDGNSSVRSSMHVIVQDYTEQLVGQPLDQALPWAQARFSRIRVIPHNESVNAGEYFPGRLNIRLDAADVVSAVYYDRMPRPFFPL